MWSDSSRKARKSNEPAPFHPGLVGRHRLIKALNKAIDPSATQQKTASLWLRLVQVTHADAGYGSTRPRRTAVLIADSSRMAPVSQIVSKVMRKLRFRHTALSVTEGDREGVAQNF